MSGEWVGPALARSARAGLAALAAALHFRHGPSWRQRIAGYPATTVYCTQLRDVGVRQRHRFAAQQYARHLEGLLAASQLATASAPVYRSYPGRCRGAGRAVEVVSQP